MKKDNNINYGQVERNFHHDEATLTDTERDASVENLFDKDPFNENEEEVQYKEDDLHDINHETNDYNRNENIPNEERVINEDEHITNDQPDNPDDDFNQNDIDPLEKEDDLDNDDASEDLEECDEHFPEKHPRE